MQENQELDMSFGYYLCQDCPDTHIKEALHALLSSRMSDEDTEQEAQDQLLSKIRWLIASNPNTPSSVLDRLMTKADWPLLERIAEHPKTTAQSLARLGFHESPEVRAAVAENANTPREVIEMLAGDENPDVRYRLAENHALDGKLLQQLCMDENPYVAHRAQMTLSQHMPKSVIQAEFYRESWTDRKHSAN